MSFFNKKFVIAYLCCSACFTLTGHIAGYAPWSEIGPDQYAVLDAYDGTDGPGKGLYEQSLEDGIVSNMEYLVVTSFHEQYKQKVEEGKKNPS